MIEHVAGLVRIVSYPTPKSSEAVDAKRILNNSGLLLGREIDDDDVGKSSFKIPNSARPLSYDANSESEEAYSYSDGRLLYDLGALLGQVYSHDLVLDGQLGSNVAIVEFTHSQDRRLFLVPGVECYAKSINEGENPFEYYESKIDDEFHNRFSAAKPSFRIGFDTASIQQ